MIDKSMPGLSPIWLIGLALALGITIVTVFPFVIAGGDTIKGSDWIGFAGSVIGATITLVAAYIAYTAVMEQTLRSERIAIRRETEALECLKADLFPVFSILNVIWKFADRALESGLDERRRAFRNVQTTFGFHLLPTRAQVADLRKMAEQILPTERYRFGAVAMWLDSFDDLKTILHRDLFIGETEIVRQTQVISLLQTHLTALYKAVERFEPSLAAVFAGRRHSDRFGLTMADQLDGMYQSSVMQEEQMFDE